MDMIELERRWRTLDHEIRGWWDADLNKAQEDEIRNPELNRIWYSDEEHRKQERQGREEVESTLLYLPFSYTTAGGAEGTFPEMYCWDVYFTNLGLAAHGRYDIIRNHILNQLFMIERYGMVLNGNRNYYLGRSQAPVHALSTRLYYNHIQDRDLLSRAYPVLKSEYLGYWMAEHHNTINGLATNRDLTELEFSIHGSAAERVASTRLRPELAAEAEVLDFTAIFDGDVRKCNPLMTNSALVHYAKTLAWMAAEIGWQDEAKEWQEEADQRTSKMRELCWNDEKGFFFEFQYEKKEQLPYWSLAGYWAMWAGIATSEQSEQMVENLHRFEKPFGLPQTDRIYPSPHPEFDALQWDYPNGWPPSHIVVIDALEAYGYAEEAKRVALKYLKLQLDIYDQTGKLWEKYNVVDGSLNLPRERYPVVPLHGWSSASVVYLGRKVFGE